MDRLTSMSVFVKAVDLGSFAAASAALDLSAPMVGKYVRSIEERLGVRLINRTTRRQNLTEFGRIYYERCKAVLAEADAADALAADQLSEPRGRLRVTMPVHFGRRCVAPILLDLAAEHPGLELDLSFTDRLSDLAEDGYDLAVRTGTLDDTPDLIARRLGRQRMIVCASPSYLDAHGAPGTIDDIGRHRCLAYRRAGLIAPWLFQRNDQAIAEIMPPGRLAFDDLAAIADAAETAAGIAWLPSWLIRERLEAGTLIRLLPDEPAFPYDAYAVWLRTPHLPMKLRLSVDALTARLPALMA